MRYERQKLREYIPGLSALEEVIWAIVAAVILVRSDARLLNVCVRFLVEGCGG